MELIILLIMLVAGISLAVVILVAHALLRSRDEMESPRTSAPDRDQMIASILFQIIRAGGAAPAEAHKLTARQLRFTAPIVEPIDISSWAQRFARVSDGQERMDLLDLCVRSAMLLSRTFPLAQYSALLDLSFGLGFQTDALARLRERHGFHFVDHAKQGRPRAADRAGGSTPLFERQGVERGPLLQVLGLGPEVSRHELVSAYRRLAAIHHPDRFHEASAEERSRAAARFIEISRAYETLLPYYDD